MLNALFITSLLTLSGGIENIVSNKNQDSTEQLYDFSKKIFIQTYKPENCTFEKLYVFVVDREKLYDVANFDKKYTGYYGAYFPKRKHIYVLEKALQKQYSEYLVHEFGHYFADSCGLGNFDVSEEHKMLEKYEIKYNRMTKEK